MPAAFWPHPLLRPCPSRRKSRLLAQNTPQEGWGLGQQGRKGGVKGGTGTRGEKGCLGGAKEQPFTPALGLRTEPCREGLPGQGWQQVLGKEAATVSRECPVLMVTRR